MGNLGERIRELRGDMQQSELANRLGIHKNTISNYEKGDRFPDSNVLLKILELFQEINPAWLLTGDLPKRRSDQCPQSFVTFPQQGTKIKAKSKFLNEGKQISDVISFKAEWLENDLNVPYHDLTLLIVQGDNMSPTLNDGDLTLIDLRASRLEDGAIYVIEFDDALLVKRVQKKLDASIIIKNDNNLYESESLSPDQAAGLKIVGRVIWTGKKL